jgi:hypothetical protein
LVMAKPLEGQSARASENRQADSRSGRCLATTELVFA